MLNGTFTNTTAQPVESVDVGRLFDIGKGLHNEFVQSFVDLPIKVDETLERGYYIAVSRELFEEIERMKEDD